MTSMIRFHGAVLLLVTCSFGCATAKRWGGLAVHDARAIVSAPRQIEADTWKKAALAAGAIAASVALDETVRDAARAGTTGTGDDISEVAGPFGGRYSDRVMAGFLVVGLAAKNDRAKAVAFDAFVSSLVASKIVTPALKQLTGRDRPNESDGPFEFDGGSAFPSNHSTQAFAVASVVAYHYQSPWVDAAAYALATLVGASRIYDDAHWLSDVVAGAVIGSTTGRFIAATNRRRRATWTVSPIYDERRRGAMVSINFRAQGSVEPERMGGRD